jgi:hypothetical protein
LSKLYLFLTKTNSSYHLLKESEISCNLADTKWLYSFLLRASQMNNTSKATIHVFSSCPDLYALST